MFVIKLGPDAYYPTKGKTEIYRSWEPVGLQSARVFSTRSAAKNRKVFRHWRRDGEPEVVGVKLEEV